MKKPFAIVDDPALNSQVGLVAEDLETLKDRLNKTTAVVESLQGETVRTRKEMPAQDMIHSREPTELPRASYADAVVRNVQPKNQLNSFLSENANLVTFKRPLKGTPSISEFPDGADPLS